MGRWVGAADFSRGLDLLLLGTVAVIVGNYVRSLSATGVDSFTGVRALTLVRAAAEVPAAVGTAVTAVGVLVAVGGPLLFWVVGPLYLRWDRWREARRVLREE
ncbi:MAG: hypothetical protein ABEH47_09300 [Haloferacaceae archaeon]